MPSRRTLLRVLSVGIVAFSGCVDQSKMSSNNSSRTATETPTPTETEQCRLFHEVLEEDEYDNLKYHDKFDFENLSELAQKVFIKAFEEEGYVYPYNGDNAPSEFHYSDERSNYLITYENKQYILFTSSGGYCIVG